uniref:Uncharacterized protein n=1 Tax=Oryza sativa subsp. japonica TaxID=39947 RepID=Q6Z9V7_ORYSJ|nr:hypothetical protein [Oryza sativa Japonica Group]BAC99618.1 hypothetical protein [Oryza sativa Japonica Group]
MGRHGPCAMCSLALESRLQLHFTWLWWWCGARVKAFASSLNNCYELQPSNFRFH